MLNINKSLIMLPHSLKVTSVEGEIASFEVRHVCR